MRERLEGHAEEGDRVRVERPSRLHEVMRLVEGALVHVEVLQVLLHHLHLGRDAMSVAGLRCSEVTALREDIRQFQTDPDKLRGGLRLSVEAD